jgi:hypothetical protein
MPIRIDTLTGVPESKLLQLVQDFRDFDNADIVTAVRENGTFAVDSTILDGSAGGATITITGKMSTFGGPDDTGVGKDEGLSLFEPTDVQANPDLFLPAQPNGTTGLARRLDPQAKYLACRWNEAITPKSFLKLNTTLVTVTNPANNKSEKARPADTGPNADTGRVADLSPGLAQALGLNTNDTCRVEIPTPAGAQLPSGPGGPVGANLAVIDSTIFPADMVRQLVVMTTSNNAIYWVSNQIGRQPGGQSLLRRVNNQTEILLSDSTVFPIQVTDKISDAVAGELNKAAPKLTPVDTGPAGNLQPGDDIGAKMLASAKAFVGFDTSKVPGTEGGNLACAWAVNEVTRRALGKPISTAGGSKGGDGLSTDGISDELNAHHTKLSSVNEARRGAIIIAPTQGAHHGHVGIVGAIAGNVGNTPVYSNSSGAKRFAQNYTIGTFTSYFTGRGLDVLFFALNPSQF